MIKNSKNQSGNAHVIATIILVVAVVGLLGFIFWQNFINKSTSKTDDASKPQSTTSTGDTKTVSEAYQPTITTGWKQSDSNDLGLKYAYSGDMQTSFAKYKVGEMITAGLGEPVFVNYSNTDKAWQTYVWDANEHPTVKADTNKVKSIAVKAEDKYEAAYYDIGDGPGSDKIRVLIVKDQDVYQIDLGGLFDEATVIQFVKTISFTE